MTQVVGGFGHHQSLGHRVRPQGPLKDPVSVSFPTADYQDCTPGNRQRQVTLLRDDGNGQRQGQTGQVRVLVVDQNVQWD